ncbi:MAG: hypothetical protein AUH30_07050 [Candidatus Rokubacteria bacterium 13_1_40CM_68_15]|nr:MAG: hypothetical protein AUH30_07050 [Candidatus Rokubacteria bacterium 13_1_40CM_68_15]
MSDASCWGILREREHSPDRENDDAEILKLTGKHLEARGFQVTFKTAEEVGEADPRPLGVFLMCERLEVLDRLHALEVRGVPHVNSPHAVLNTYRDRMIAHFSEANVPFIDSRVVSTDASADAGALPVWVKRGDVHNTQAGDVTFARTREGVAAALAGLAARGIRRAVIQLHVEGDLVKFYGIGAGARSDGGPAWFRWFYHKDQHVAGHPFDPLQLARAVRRAALALALDVYGGDAIVTPAGQLVLLDVNAWPSFALYREEAAERIAAHVALRFAGAAR